LLTSDITIKMGLSNKVADET